MVFGAVQRVYSLLFSICIPRQPIEIAWVAWMELITQYNRTTTDDLKKKKQQLSEIDEMIKIREIFQMGTLSIHKKFYCYHFTQNRCIVESD